MILGASEQAADICETEAVVDVVSEVHLDVALMELPVAKHPEELLDPVEEDQISEDEYADVVVSDVSFDEE